MTIGEFKCGIKDWAREQWWDGAGLVVAAFLISTFLWNRSDNDYLLYAALIAVIIHAYISSRNFEKNRVNRKHVEEIAVAYREQLKLQEELNDPPIPERTAPGRNGRTPHRAPRLVALSGRTVA